MTKHNVSEGQCKCGYFHTTMTGRPHPYQERSRPFTGHCSFMQWQDEMCKQPPSAEVHDVDGMTADGQPYELQRRGLVMLDKDRDLHYFMQRLQEDVHRIAKEHGFWEGNLDNLYSKIALMHSELSEALEEVRRGVDIGQVYYSGKKPEGVRVELADCVIRILDFAQRYGIDLIALIEEKMAYNAGREWLHGKSA